MLGWLYFVNLALCHCIVLITQVYHPECKERFHEILCALDLNTNNEFISEVHLLQYDPFVPMRLVDKHRKVKITNIKEERMSFSTALEYANTLPKDTIVAIANNDISFDHTLENIIDYSFLLREKFHAFFLSRHEEEQESNQDGIGTQCGSNYIGSHDAFIFAVPISKRLITNMKGVYLGQPGADARFIYEARKAGYVVRNPCVDVRIMHHHKSNHRSTAMIEANLLKSDTARPESLDDLFKYPGHRDH